MQPMHRRYVTCAILALLCSIPTIHADSASTTDIAEKEEQGIKVSPGTAALIEMAEAGDADAANTLGLQYGNGLSVMQDDVEALKWYRRAAKLGNIEAEYNLGSVYQNGFGVNRDDVQAADWYRKAAQHGYAEAQNSLALMYERGQGVKQDYELAAQWYRKAAMQGLAIAEQNLQSLIDRKLVPE